MAADGGLLRVALAAARHFIAVLLLDVLDAFDDALDDAFGDYGCSGCHTSVCEQGFGSGFARVRVVVAENLRVQGLRQLRAVAIERVGFECQFPRQHVGLFAVLNRRVVRHVDGLRDGARDERLRRRHHVDVARDREKAFALAAARIGAVEHGQMFGLNERCAFERHRPADVLVGGFDVAFREAEVGEEIKRRIGELFGGNLERVDQEGVTECPTVEHELDVEGSAQAAFDFCQAFVRESSSFEARVVDGGGLAQRGVANRVGFDLGDLVLRIAERAKGFRHRLVDNLEVAAARELLEFDEGEVGFNPGRVAVHDEADGASWRDDSRLRVAVTVLFAKRQRAVPGTLRRFDETLVGARGVVERHGRHREFFITVGEAVSRAAVVAHDAQHFRRVRRVPREGSQFAGHFAARGI